MQTQKIFMSPHRLGLSNKSHRQDPFTQYSLLNVHIFSLYTILPDFFILRVLIKEMCLISSNDDEKGSHLPSG